MIDKWLKKLGLEKWTIKTVEINPESVTYPEDISKEDKFFIGIIGKQEELNGTIYHDRPLTEEDVVHELLHIKYPNWSEDQVNIETEKLLR